MRLLSLAAALLVPLSLLAADKENGELDKLIKQLKTKKSADRITALESIGKLGADGMPAFQPICEMLFNESSEKVLSSAADTLEKLNAKLGPAVVTAIVDQDEAKQLAAIKEIADQGKDGAMAVGVIQFHLKRVFIVAGQTGVISRRLLEADAEALAAVAPEEASTVKALSSTASALSKAQNGEGDASALVRKIGQLALDHEKVRKVAIPELTGFLRSPAAEIKLEAIKSLAGLGKDAKAALPTLRLLKFDGSEDIRKAAKSAIDDIE